MIKIAIIIIYNIILIKIYFPVAYRFMNVLTNYNCNSFIWVCCLLLMIYIDEIKRVLISSGYNLIIMFTRLLLSFFFRPTQIYIVKQLEYNRINKHLVV